VIKKTDTDNGTSQVNKDKVKQYYSFHAQIYDVSRWSFLFGRKAILNMIPDLPPNPEIMEIGCGTGQNIRRLVNHFPDAQILGIDLSGDMLNVARNKLLDNSDQVDLLRANYRSDQLNKESFDLILLSYSLTMIEGRLKDLLVQITGHLKPNGYVAIVDFHTSPFAWFRRWMAMNHVNLNRSLLSMLQKHFCPVKTEVNQAYAGLWSYFLYLGKQN
jgi:S-adenosylmethionine-diacylgycerolhomoserine-N-methlytransferase